MKKLAVIVPTYNEFECLDKCIDSLLNQQGIDLDIFVINAGAKLPPEIQAKVKEYSVPSNYFWGACIERGFEILREEKYPFIMLMNADTTIIPGSIKHLIDLAKVNEHYIACSGVYVEEKGKLKTQYTNVQCDRIYAWRPLRKLWDDFDCAPDEPIEIDIICGQGVLFSKVLIDQLSVDYKTFPHDKSDHDLWISAREKGYRFWIVPQSGVVHGRERNPSLWHQFTHIFYYCYLQWKLAKKHLPIHLALLSFAYYSLNRLLAFPF